MLKPSYEEACFAILVGFALAAAFRTFFTRENLWRGYSSVPSASSSLIYILNSVGYSDDDAHSASQVLDQRLLIVGKLSQDLLHLGSFIF
mmetsp:Transcript_5680/g.14483  ORF Transcript_5680/g.14483 Transcript_5680/m.14483 type:complete len:90 (+) Transcript_5680:243-512(+)